MHDVKLAGILGLLNEPLHRRRVFAAAVGHEKDLGSRRRRHLLLLLLLLLVILLLLLLLVSLSLLTLLLLLLMLLRVAMRSPGSQSLMIMVITRFLKRTRYCPRCAGRCFRRLKRCATPILRRSAASRRCLSASREQHYENDDHLKRQAQRWKPPFCPKIASRCNEPARDATSKCLSVHEGGEEGGEGCRKMGCAEFLQMLSFYGMIAAGMSLRSYQFHRCILPR